MYEENKRPENTFLYLGLASMVVALLLFWLFGNPSFDLQLFDTYLVITWFYAVSLIAWICFLVGGIYWMLRKL